MSEKILINFLIFLLPPAIGLGAVVTEKIKSDSDSPLVISQSISSEPSEAIKETSATGQILALNSNLNIETNQREDIRVSNERRHRDDDDEEDEDEDEEDEDEDEDDNNQTEASTRNVSSGLVNPPPKSSAPTLSPAPVSNRNQTPTPTVKTFTFAEVALHNSAKSCWSAIGTNVYDLTSYVSQHPGGSGAIKSLCGVDGTAAFSAQHGGASRPASELASLKVGVLLK